MKPEIRTLLMAATALAAAAATANAQLASHGPPSVHGFPTVYTDSNNLSLAHMIDPDPFIVLDVLPVPGDALDVGAGNFYGESFYFLAGAGLDTSGGAALVVMAIEGVWGNLDEAVVQGDQVVFNRLRIRVDVSGPGTYTVIHPYGTDVFDVTQAIFDRTGGVRAINFTDDCLHTIPASCTPGATAFSTPIEAGARVGPTYLQWDPAESAPPADHIGAAGVPHTVIGSPAGTNFFSILGPDIGGPGVDVVTTDLFDLQGIIADPAPVGIGLVQCLGDGSGAPCPCGNESGTPGEGCLTASGRGMTIAASGSTSIAADDLLLTASNTPINTGIFYVGQSSLHPGNPLFDGLQCAQGPTHRYPGLNSLTGVITQGGLVADEPSGNFFVPGGSYVFQYFSRDVAGPCAGPANFSPGLLVTMTP